MKQHKPTPRKVRSIRSWLIIFFTVFTAVSLVLLLLFQVLFLDDFYEYITIHSVKTAADDVAAAVNEGDSPEDYIEYWNVKEQFDICVVGRDGTMADGSAPNTAWNTLDAQALRRLFEEARQNGGALLRREEISLSMPMRANDQPPFGERNKRPPQSGGDIVPPQALSDGEQVIEKNDAVVYALLTEDEAMVVVVAMITPVDATIGTLYVQFILAAVVLIAFAVVMALLIARKITRPIETIHTAAKGLAAGTYRSPDGGSYKEAEELRQTLDQVAVELRKNEQLQREWIANVSHDLRTPLTMITGYSEAIRDLPGENSAENIQVVIDETHRLTALVNDVLDLSKLQSGTQSVEMAPLSLTQILCETLSRVETMVAKDGYRIVFEKEEPITVCGDELRLSQVMYNLLGNALAHTGEDKCVTVKQQRVGDAVRVSVSDSGSGIPKEELDSIWERYYQVHSEGSHRQVLHSGLGLSIVKTLVTLHHGIYGVDSTVGEGTTFWFELPLL